MSKGSIGRLYSAFWQYAEGRRALVAAFLSLLFLAQVTRLATPYFFGQAVNALQDPGAQDIREAARNMALLFGTCIVAWALHGPGRVIERFTAVRIRERFSDALYAKLMRLPMRWHAGQHSGATIQRMGKATAALFGFSQQQFVYLQNLISLVGPIVALFLISASAGSAALVGYLVIGVIIVRFDRIVVGLIQEENRAERYYAAGLVDYLGNISTVVALRLQAATRRALAARLTHIFTPLRKNIVVNEAKWCVVDLLNGGIRCGLVVLYGWLAWREHGIILLGTAVMVHQYAQQIGNVVSSMATNWHDLVRYQADISGGDPILAAEEPAPMTACAIPAEWHEIRVDGLSFSYADHQAGAPALHEISLALRRGDRVALVGASGSGKSTLLRVLAGLYAAQRALFTIDGVARTGMQNLGAIATLVPQDPEIFESSIGHNVTMGLDQTPSEVRRACELACLTPVIEALPEGLETEISERGVNLSGGQKQRLALARGILASRGSSLIMLDEPTSSLDAATEVALYRNLLAEFPNACVVSSIHRLHLLPMFDVVVLLAEGRIVDRGSMAELLARQPGFNAMWRSYVGAAGHGAGSENSVPLSGSSVLAA
jgi:ABC-type multidrug transport system fused ATPase/permease subunit